MVNGVSASTQQTMMTQRVLGRRKRRRKEMARLRRRRKKRWRLDCLAGAMGWWRICPKQTAQWWVLPQEMLLMVSALCHGLHRCAHRPCLASI